MALIKSKLSKKVDKEECDPKDQALAIALEVKRRAKGMADGGMVSASDSSSSSSGGTYAERFQRGFLGQAKKHAEGGFVKDQPLAEMPMIDTDSDSDSKEVSKPKVFEMILNMVRKKK